MRENRKHGSMQEGQEKSCPLLYLFISWGSPALNCCNIVALKMCKTLICLIAPLLQWLLYAKRKRKNNQRKTRQYANGRLRNDRKSSQTMLKQRQNHRPQRLDRKKSQSHPPRPIRKYIRKRLTAKSPKTAKLAQKSRHSHKKSPTSKKKTIT